MFGSASTREAPLKSETRWAVFEAEAMPHVSSLFRIAMWLTRNQADAEDLVQETLTEGLGSFHRFTHGTNCRVDFDYVSPAKQKETGVDPSTSH